MFIDVSKEEKRPYINFFIDKEVAEGECVVLKVSLPPPTETRPSVKIEKFNLTKYNYLTAI